MIEHYIRVIEDLSRDIPDEERYQRLLSAIRQTIPCDAIALLQLQGDHLIPLAVQGLSDAIRGRHFELDQHPRLARILEQDSPVRFESDSPLPDPYDGLVQDATDALHVHDCMGISLRIDNAPWGVITLDAMEPGRFDNLAADQQQTAVALTRAVITAARRIDQLKQRLHHDDQVTTELNREQTTGTPIGTSKPMQQLLEDIATVAPTQLSVLLQGETGVGKEVVARHLHWQSERLHRPFVQVNCAALPEALAEAELFGHTRGAFTGAGEARSGRIELADEGTLFLDEVGEIPLSVQAKFLRVLQEGEIQRVGSDEPVKVDVRIIAATNRNLQEEVRQGRFRADLYHRLSVYPIEIPPLRERGRDILQLAEHFLERDQARLNIRKLVLDGTARDALMAYSWPGNVRELEHLISRAALRAARNQDRARIVHIEAGDLGLETETAPRPAQQPQTDHQRPVPLALNAAVEDFKRQLIRRELEEQGHNIAATARALQTDRSNLLRLMKRLGIH